ncbi:MAG TPA: hypothetical protein VJ583_02040 [Nitrososphaeraceae archaeon]|nr:hypothetical protein [Nitrososphaeraceae archaeon]
MDNHILIKSYKNYIVCSLFASILFFNGINFPLSSSQEETRSTQNTTDDNSITLSDQSKGTVQITKTATASYNIVNDSTGLLGTFDTTYTIIGNSDSLSKSKDLIITMVISDFDKSPTIGYIRAADVEHIFDVSNKTDSSPPALPNPFADEQTINYTLSQEISNAIDAAQNIKFTTVAIQCNFGMNIMDWKCKDHGIYG